MSPEARPQVQQPLQQARARNWPPKRICSRKKYEQGYTTCWIFSPQPSGDGSKAVKYIFHQPPLFFPSHLMTVEVYINLGERSWASTTLNAEPASHSTMKSDAGGYHVCSKVAFCPTINQTGVTHCQKHLSKHHEIIRTSSKLFHLLPPVTTKVNHKHKKKNTQLNFQVWKLGEFRFVAFSGVFASASN